jgi:penicillin-binding protein 1A
MVDLLRELSSLARPKAKVLGRPVAGKTGTTNDYTDAWFVGFTPSPLGSGWGVKRSPRQGEVGAKAALPIWIDFIRQITETPSGRIH